MKNILIFAKQMIPKRLHISQQVEFCLYDFRSEYSERIGRYVIFRSN